MSKLATKGRPPSPSVSFVKKMLQITIAQKLTFLYGKKKMPQPQLEWQHYALWHILLVTQYTGECCINSSKSFASLFLCKHISTKYLPCNPEQIKISRSLPLHSLHPPSLSSYHMHPKMISESQPPAGACYTHICSLTHTHHHPPAFSITHKIVKINVILIYAHIGQLQGKIIF